jgi:tetratricopeptide (TPR) repeat protein/predicted Ser/Thr protein kinase
MIGPLVQPPASMIGTTVQHYLVRERLGAGGMGEVYLAEDVRLGRPVALKFLLEHVHGDPERRGRLMTEARAASALRSSNIAAIYDIGEYGGSLFLVMEYVEGELLSAKLAEGPLPVREALDVGIQVADALDEAHGRGIIHRDIKSANIMITPRGQVKILDFGLARILGPYGVLPTGDDRTLDVPQLTMPGTLLGTVLYMSPEQARGKPADHRSDLFSLGVVLYESLTGRLPFAADSLPEVLDRLLHRDPRPVSSVVNVLSDLDAVVGRALAKDPASRYQSARDLMADLTHVKSVLGGRSARTGGAPAANTGVAQASAPTIAVMTFSNITKEPTDEWIGSGIAETVTADLKNVQGLSVIGRERIFDALRNMGSDDTTPEERFGINIGRTLGARWIVGGGFQRSGEHIRITARLVDVQTGALAKTLKIDGRTSDIFELQDRIVVELSRSLDVHLDRSDIAAIARSETESVEAYESYSKGMMTLRLASRDSLDRAIYLFEKAVEHDPNYARAWAALGQSYGLKAQFFSLPDLNDKAIEMEKRAIALDPSLVNGYSFLGSAYLGSGRYDEAIAAISRAVALEPGNATAHQALARAYWLGKGMFEEAITELHEATRINPEAGYSWLSLALLLTFVGNYDQAEEACRRAIELQEQYISGTEGLLVVGGHTRLGYVFYRRGQFDEAIREYQREMMFLSSSDHALKDRTLIELNQKLGAAFLRSGEAEEAQRHFKVAVRSYEDRVAKGADDPSTKYYVACLWALRGEADRAIRYLSESAAVLPALTRRRARTDPDLESLQDDPRFAELVREG